MIPLKAETGLMLKQRFAFGAMGIILANVLFFLFLNYLPSGRDLLGTVISLYSADPSVFLTGRYYTAITSTFIHSNVVHVATNMVYLWVFGSPVEERLGVNSFFLIYFLSAVAAVAGISTVFPHLSIPIVGASGAVSGLIGAYFVLYRRSKIRTILVTPLSLFLVSLPAVVYLLLWFSFQVYYYGRQEVVVARAATVGHLVGFSAGAAVCFVLIGAHKLARKFV